LSAFVGRQSRGLPIETQATEKNKPFLDAGRAAFQRRQGQLNLSCAQCHDQNWGKSLAGNPIPQAHPTGYPIYRLEWQGLGSLQRRLRNCFIGVRAAPYAYGAQEYIELELYLMVRARGMKLETPGVRP
jgi:sulfur-oxidizing protein SoxA